SVNRLSQVTALPYLTTTVYSHVVSAVANQASIYYTAYGDNGEGWMLEKLDTKTKASTPLLAASTLSTLAVLASSRDWLTWLQLDQPKSTTAKNIPVRSDQITVRTWSLNV